MTSASDSGENRRCAVHVVRCGQRDCHEVDCAKLARSPPARGVPAGEATEQALRSGRESLPSWPARCAMTLVARRRWVTGDLTSPASCVIGMNINANPHI